MAAVSVFAYNRNFKSIDAPSGGSAGSLTASGATAAALAASSGEGL
jgi:hypothetical protein